MLLASSLAAEATHNAKAVQSIKNWIDTIMGWLATKDLPALLAQATALYDQCKDALADGRLSFSELKPILKAAWKLAVAVADAQETV